MFTVFRSAFSMFGACLVCLERVGTCVNCVWSVFGVFGVCLLCLGAYLVCLECVYCV